MRVCFLTKELRIPEPLKFIPGKMPCAEEALKVW